MSAVPDVIPKEELYRRAVVLEIDDEENLAVVKIHNLRGNAYYPNIPKDTQKRKYEREILTGSGRSDLPTPIHLESNKFELAPMTDNVSKEQAKKMLADAENASKHNKKRMEEFRKKKKQNT